MGPGFQNLLRVKAASLSDEVDGTSADNSQKRQYLLVKLCSWLQTFARMHLPVANDVLLVVAPYRYENGNIVGITIAWV
jgi:hypothetical protein